MPVLRSIGLAVTLLGGALVLYPGCGSDDPGFINDPNNLDGGPDAKFGNRDGSGDPDAKPCTNLCLQQKPCPAGQTRSLSGVVTDPAGKVPLYNVIVYVPNAPVEPMTSGASCDRCGNVSGDPLVSAITNTKGEFTLTNVPVGGEIPIVVQVGKWRRQFKVNVGEECKDTSLNELALPKNRNEGDIPRIAITTGGADALECFLRKVGLDDSEFGITGDEARVHFYHGANGDDASERFTPGKNGGKKFPEATGFWKDANQLKAYDMVLLSCEGKPFEINKPQEALNALYDYTAVGGRVFASHWHRYWFHAYREGVENNEPHMKAGDARFGDLGRWRDGRNLDPGEFTVETTLPDGNPFPKGQAMKDWLRNVQGLTANDALWIVDGRINLESVKPPNSTQWITYRPGPESPPQVKAVEYMSFNVPIGEADEKKCGRVVYSDLHVSAGIGRDVAGKDWPEGCTTTDLIPQEKALEFMLFDLSSCIASDEKPPAPPPIIR